MATICHATYRGRCGTKYALDAWLINRCRFQFLFAVIFLSLGWNPSRAGQVLDTTYGTLIGAYGNGNGIVVLTDSMLATKDLNGNFVPMPETPGQKLLRLDDYTVCAVAGLNQRAVAAAPTLNSDILGIIDSYNQQARERASMERTLRNIESIVGFYIENTILVDFATHQPEQRAMDFVDCNMNCLSQLERILKEESSEQVPGR